MSLSGRLERIFYGIVFLFYEAVAVWLCYICFVEEPLMLILTIPVCLVISPYGIGIPILAFKEASVGKSVK